MRKTETVDYRAYLLRFWREGAESPWRASLENPHTGEQRGFANLEQLFAYLQEQTASAEDAPGEQNQERPQ